VVYLVQDCLILISVDSLNTKYIFTFVKCTYLSGFGEAVDLCRAPRRNGDRTVTMESVYEEMQNLNRLEYYMIPRKDVI
jgi:hypothetical protein